MGWVPDDARRGVRSPGVVGGIPDGTRELPPIVNASTVSDVRTRKKANPSTYGLRWRDDREKDCHLMVREERPNAV